MNILAEIMLFKSAVNSNIAIDFSLANDTKINLPSITQWGSFEDFYGNFQELKFEWLQQNDGYKLKSSALTGISSLTNLEMLLLNNNDINHLEPRIFSGLTNLEKLTLNNNQINKLEPGTFAGLTNLEMLTLNSNRLNHLELGAFTGLVSLVTLWLDSNEISQLEPEIFTDLTSLAELSLENNQIDNLGPLVALPSLVWLGLSGNQIESLKPLTALANLTTLGLSSNQIENLAPLASLTNLTWLNLGNNRIDKLDPLASLTNLATLGLSWNQVENLAPLAGLTELTTLNLWSNQVDNLAPLAGLTNLTTLNLWSNQVDDLAPLASLASLGELDLRNNQISALAPLAGLVALADLRLNNNQISDLRPLAKLNLSRLNVQNQTIQLPAITVGQATQLELFHRNGNAVKLHGTGFTFVGQNLVWNVTGERSATWSADILDLGDFSGTVHQSVIGDSPAEPEPAPEELTLELRLDGIGNDLAGATIQADRGSGLTFVPTLLNNGEVAPNPTFTWNFPTGAVAGTTVVNGVVTIASDQPEGDLQLNVSTTFGGQTVDAYVIINVSRHH